MRIPAEAVPYVENTAGRTNESGKTEPVRSTSAVGHELSHTTPESGKPGLERRRAERRSGSKPVLLDTRIPHFRGGNPKQPVFV